MLNFLLYKTPLSFLTQSIWRDEAFSYLLAKRDVISIITLTARDYTPPLYYILLHFWMKIFGSSEIAMRSLSLLFFIGAVYCVYLFLKNIIKIKQSRLFLCLLLFILNPFLLYYAFEARAYSLVALITTWSFYLLMKRKWLLLVIVTILGLYTHYFFIFVVATHIIYILYEEKKVRLSTLKYPLISLIGFSPWFFATFKGLSQRTHEFWIQRVTGQELLSSLSILFSGFEERQIATHFIPIASSVFFFILLCYFAYAARRQKMLLIFFGLWSFLFYYIIFLISFFKPILSPRYIIFAAVGFNLFLYTGLAMMKRFWFSLLYAVILILSLQGMAIHIDYHNKGNFRTRLHEIKTLSNPGDVIYVTDALLYFPAAYYFGEEQVYLYNNDYNAIPSYVGLVVLPREKQRWKLPLYPQKAFILLDDNTYSIHSSL